VATENRDMQRNMHGKKTGNVSSGWLTPAILATQEAEIRRIAVPSQPVQKVSEILISTNKTGVVVHISVVSAIHKAMGRKITVFTSL
jgi:hypothetical protein